MAAIPARHDADAHPHHEYEYGPTDYGRVSAALKRVSWGAILAGAVVAAVLHFLLYLLGIGIGLQAFNPTEGDSVGAYGTGQGIWLIISGLIALFAGGWVAGRLAGMPRRVDGALHGLVTWAVGTIVALYFLASGIGSVFNGVQSVVRGGAGLVGQGISAVAPQAADAIGNQLQQADLSGIQQEAQTLLRDVATTPGDAQSDVQNAINRTLGGSEPITEADREDLAQTLAANTDLSGAEARQTVDQWAAQAEQARQRVGQTVTSAQQQAPRVAENVTDAIGTAALWAFAALLLGAIAAAVGGLLGSPHDLPAVAVRRETDV